MNSFNASTSGARRTPQMSSHCAMLERAKCARARVDLGLPVQRQMIVVLSHRDLCQQAGGRDALVDHLRRYRRGLDRLAARAGVLAANVTQYEEPRRHAVQLLAARAPKPTHRRAASASAAHAHTRSTTPAAAHYGPAPTRCPSTPTPDTPPPVPGSAPSAVDPCSPRFVRRHHGCKVLSFGGRAKDGLPERLRLRSKPTPG